MARELQGDRLVRIGFVDESGRSKFEPTLVVAGVVVHGDRSYRAICDHLSGIAAEFIPESDREDFLFHATDIFHGSGYFKDREKWPPPKRFPILEAVAAIPAKFGLPVVFGDVPKTRHTGAVEAAIQAAGTPRHRHQYVIDGTLHGVAFAMTEIAIEIQMRKFPRDEICMVVAEDVDSVKRAIRIGHKMLKKPLELAVFYPRFQQYDLPLTRIVEGPFFKAKGESPPLQVADTCAFLLTHRLRRDEGTQKYFELIAPQLTITTNGFGEKMGTEKIGGGQQS